MRSTRVMTLIAMMGLSVIAQGALIESVVNTSPTVRAWSIATLTNGVYYAEGRPKHIWVNVPPAVLNAEYLRFHHDDRNEANFSANFTLTEAADVYLLIDRRVGDSNPANPPNLAVTMQWVIDAGFEDTGLVIDMDESSDGSINNYGQIYKKTFPAGVVYLYTQNSGSINMYGVAAVVNNTNPLLFAPISPAIGASGVVTNPVISCTIVDGTDTLNSSSVEMTLNGSTVAHSTSKSGTVSTVSYAASDLVPLSINAVQVIYAGATSGPFTNSWSFTTVDYLVFGSTVPANGKLGVSTNTVISCTINDGAEALDNSSVIMTLNGNTVAHSTSKSGTVSTVSYSATLDGLTAYTAQVVYASETSNPYTNSWSFTTLDPNPPPAELIGRWLAGAADYADKSGYTPAGTHDGTIAGTGTGFYFTNDVPGQATGSSLYLANTNCLVIGNTKNNDSGYVNTFDGNISTKFSACFWAKGFATSGDWAPALLSKDGEGAGWQVRRQWSMNPIFTLRGTAGLDDPGGSITVTTTDWHHYAATWDAVTGVRRFYIDGQLATEVLNDTGTVLASGAHLVIGAREGWGGAPSAFVKGISFYDVRMYNAALSQSEVAAIIGDSAPVTPTLSIAVVNNQAVVTWDVGTLLETTSLQYGGWTTNSAAVSPYQVDTTAPEKFFKVQNP